MNQKRKKRKSVGSVASNVVKRHNFNSSRKAATKMSKKQAANKSRYNSKKKGGKKKKYSKLKKAILILFLLGFLLFLVAIGIFCGIFFSDKFALSREDLLLSKANTIVYDIDGNVIAELSGDENREIISYSEMSPYLSKAFVSIEDERFYKHHGVDWKRTLGAASKFLTKNGESSYGGSTITQQLIKNITNERESSGQAGAERKIKEMSRAYQVEKMISKDQILELYLNIIPLGADGGDICGVEMASTYYFNKSASELTLEESAFLAGINHSPNSYNPFRNTDDEEKHNAVMEKIRKRTLTVLQKMKELGNITPEEYDAAVAKVNEGLPFNKGELPTSTIRSYFIEAAVDEVIDDLVEQKGITEEYARSRVFGGGYKIYTTMQPHVQESLESTFKSDEFVLTSSQADTHSQSAMVIIDYRKGQVAGCMGGLGEDVDAIGINRATNMKRQPGSSFKPIVTYGCGIERGTITAGTVYNDTPTSFGNYRPKNAGGYLGNIPVRKAIEVSSNTVACKIMSETGPDNAIDFARECGISSLVKADENDTYNDSSLSLALGGLTYGVSPLEMAAAYSMIANDGVYISPTFYTKVEDSTGEVVIEPQQETRRVMSEQNAYIMKSLLKMPVEGSAGTATNCRISGIDVGAKTGTTDDNYDRWLCGITPYYAGAAWYGYDNNGYKAVVNGSGNYASKVWISVMRKVHDGLESASFERPSGIVDVRICRDSGKRAGSGCTDTYTEIFTEGTIPGVCEGHSSLRICDESGLLATEYCPEEATHAVANIPEKERNGSWRSSSEGTPSEYCDIHTAPANNNNNNNNNGNNNNNQDVVVTTDVTVSNVIGLSESAAKGKLKGLTVKTTTGEGEAGKVVKQSISAGERVANGTTIVITIGTGNSSQQGGNNEVENTTD